MKQTYLDFVVGLVQVNFSARDQVGKTEGGRAGDACFTVDQNFAIFRLYMIDERDRLIEVGLCVRLESLVSKRQKQLFSACAHSE